jgi:electron transport complex protein RnfC
MLKISTFSKGGIHPPDRKYATHAKEIVRLETPDTVTIPFSQHLGVPAKPLVAKGDAVTAGQKIGEAAGFISADIHSPVAGTVKEIKDIYLPNGLKCSAAVIDVDHEQVLETSEPVDWKSLDAQKMIETVKDLGIVGMGGATFPAHVKFSLPKGKKAEYLVINGVECEPYLTSDHRVMLERSDELLQGAMIIAKMVDAKKIVIGIENNKPDAMDHLQKIIDAQRLPIEIQPLKLKYPQGDEKQLLKAVTGREVPSGALPIDIGAVVSNVGSTVAVYEAIVYGKPLVERVVTVSGGAIQNPGNFLVTIGTPLSQLIEACGGFTEQPVKMVAGGPMMGFAFYDLETPVVKGTSGILALTDSESREQVTTSCISCGRCVQACPMGLRPTKLFKFVDKLMYAEAMENNLNDCKECGCCAYVCPAKLPLVQSMRLGKKMARKTKK